MLSVILPVYNAEAYILGSVNSILKQSYSEFELIVIDDASTDNTVHIIESLHDERIKLIKKPVNTGYTDSLNMALECAAGKYIARMDADDIAHPDRLAKQVEYMESNTDCVLCGSFVKLIPGNTVHTYPVQHDEILEQLFFCNAFAHPTVIIRKSVLDSYTLRYDKSFEPTEDYELWSRLAVLGMVHNLNQTYLHYRVHDNQISSYKRELQQNNKHRVRMNMFKRIDERIDEHDDFLKTNLISDYENNEKIVLELKRRYTLIDRLMHVNKEKQVYPTKVFKRVCARVKKELIRSLTVKHAHTGTDLFFKLLTQIPKSLCSLGMIHSTTFLFRSITNEFGKR